MMIGLASLVYLFRIGMTVGNYGNREFQQHPPPGLIVLLENMIDLSWVAICVFLVAPGRKSDPSLTWLLLGTSLGMLCIKLATSGGKVALIPPLIEAAIVVHYAKRRGRVSEVLSLGRSGLMMRISI